MLALQFIGVTTPKARRPRVLLAEDHALLRKAIRVALERDGFDVVEASDGAALVQALQGSVTRGDPAPDLILSDQGMPGVTGLEVLNGLRDAQWPLPFVLMSGKVDSRMEAEAFRLGARAVLEKPFDLAELRRIVREALAMPSEAHVA